MQTHAAASALPLGCGGSGCAAGADDAAQPIKSNCSWTEVSIYYKRLIVHSRAYPCGCLCSARHHTAQPPPLQPAAPHCCIIALSLLDRRFPQCGSVHAQDGQVVAATASARR